MDNNQSKKELKEHHLIVAALFLVVILGSATMGLTMFGMACYSVFLGEVQPLILLILLAMTLPGILITAVMYFGARKILKEGQE